MSNCVISIETNDHHMSPISETAYTQFTDESTNVNYRRTTVANNQQPIMEISEAPHWNDLNQEGQPSSTSIATTTSMPDMGRKSSNASKRSQRILNQLHTHTDDTESISSRLSFGSTNDGIDVLGGALGKPSNFLDWSHLIAARIASSVLYKRTMLMFILVAAILLAVRTMDTIRESTDISNVLDILLRVLLVVFTVEILLAVACYKELIIPTGWLLSDILIICIVWWTSDLTFLVLRSFRLIRALRKASGVPALQWAVRAILHVLPRLTAVVFVLLPSMLAIFAILFTNLYQDAELFATNTFTDDAGEQQQYVTVSNNFDRLDVSLLTLFQIMTGGRNWADVCSALMSQGTYPMAWLPMVGFVIISLFFATTLIVALMCDAVSTVKRDRMWKSLDSTTTKYDRNSTKAIIPSTPSEPTEFVEQKQPHQLQQQDHQRLEHKLDELTNTVETLLRIQMKLQESIHVLTMQQMEATAKHQSQQSLSTRQPHPQYQFASSIRNTTSLSSASYSTAMVPAVTTVPSDEH